MLKPGNFVKSEGLLWGLFEVAGSHFEIRFHSHTLLHLLHYLTTQLILMAQERGYDRKHCFMFHDVSTNPTGLNLHLLVERRWSMRLVQHGIPAPSLGSLFLERLR